MQTKLPASSGIPFTRSNSLQEVNRDIKKWCTVFGDLVVIVEIIVEIFKLTLFQVKLLT